MRVHLVQCLCPQRHAIMALAWLPGEQVHGAGDIVFRSSEEACAGLRALIEYFIKDHQIDPWCGICKSREFRYEDGVTKFRTMAKANKALHEQQTNQMLTRALIEAGRIQEHN